MTEKDENDKDVVEQIVSAGIESLRQDSVNVYKNGSKEEKNGAKKDRANTAVDPSPGVTAVSGGDETTESFPPEESGPVVGTDGVVRANIVNEAELEANFRAKVKQELTAATELSKRPKVVDSAPQVGLSRNTKITVVVFLLAGAAFAAIVGVLLPNAKDKDLSDEGTDQLSQFDYLKDLFVPISGEEAFDSEMSAQYQALYWMAEEDELDLDVYDPENELDLIERYVMMVVYYSTDGPNWTDQLLFGSNYTTCEWPNIGEDENSTYTPNEVDCDDDGRIVKIRIEENNLNGTIPSELSALPAVEIITFGNNGNLGGTFPTEIGLLSTLTFWQMAGCPISGTIPSELAQLTDLEIINMYRSQLTGTLPEITRFASLDAMDFGENNLIGTIPEITEASTGVRFIFLEGNNFEGTIPVSFFSLPNVEILSFGNNLLTGTIPTEVGGLADLNTFWIDGNQLTGTIPTEMGNLKSMGWLGMQNNPLLEGTLPSELGAMRELWNIDISNCGLEGTLPSEWGVLDQLRLCTLASNGLTGTVPETYVDMTALEQFRIQNTSITGGLEETFCLQESLITSVRADCGGDDPTIECSCCTDCCIGGDDCELELLAVCEIQGGKFEQDQARNTTCLCMNNGTRLECTDETCPSCNIDGDVCVLNTKYGYGFNETTGDLISFHNTMEYVSGWPGTVLAIDVPDQGACEFYLDGEKCRDCSGITCQSGFQGYSVFCDNIEGGTIFDMCEEFIKPGPLEILFAYDPSQLTGCPLLIERP